MNVEDKEIKYSFGGVIVTTQYDVGRDCGVVEIPHLGLKINGAWDWGVHNQRKPQVVGILLGARQVLGGYFTEHVMEGSIEKYPIGVLAIEAALHRYVLGDVRLDDNHNVAVATGVLMVDGAQYEITRTADFDVNHSMRGTTCSLTTTLTWKKSSDVEALSVTTCLHNGEIQSHLNGRTTEELALHYINRYGVPSNAITVRT